MQKIIEFEDGVTEALTEIGEMTRSDAQGVVGIYRLVIERAFTAQFAVDETAHVINRLSNLSLPVVDPCK